MRLDLAHPLDLASTLHSGQSFRWRTIAPGVEEGFIGHRFARVRVRDGALECEAEPGLDAEALRAYFREDGSHARFLAQVRRDAPLEAALAAYPGLRLLRQDPWEMLVSYIVSANSNVPKIERTLEALADRLGTPTDDLTPRRRFPGPEAVARSAERELRATGMGYRAPLLRAAAHRVARGDLDPGALADMAYPEAHRRLLELPGVGPKVADCVLLYGCGHTQAFPVDVWIARVLREAYFPRRRLRAPEVGAWARRHFGPWAGYAQHYLFHYRRAGFGPPRAATASTQRSPRRRSSTSDANRASTARGGACRSRSG